MKVLKCPSLRPHDSPFPTASEMARNSGSTKLTICRPGGHRLSRTDRQPQASLGRSLSKYTYALGLCLHSARCWPPLSFFSPTRSVPIHRQRREVILGGGVCGLDHRVPQCAFPLHCRGGGCPPPPPSNSTHLLYPLPNTVAGCQIGGTVFFFALPPTKLFGCSQGIGHHQVICNVSLALAFFFNVCLLLNVCA